jgi:monomeric isocitrate dehydrogenase
MMKSYPFDLPMFHSHLESFELLYWNSDATFMSVKALQEFYETEVKDAKDTELLMSLHLKATMMKVSDPIMVGCLL